MTPYGTAPAPPEKGSIGLALVCGLGAAIAGAVVWGLIAYISKHQFSIVAVLIGLAVGSTVARFRTRDPLAAIASAVLAVLGCALGNFLALIFALAGAGVSVTSILGHLNLIAAAYPHSLGGITLLFWAIAAFIGFRIPFSKTGLGGVARRRGGQLPAPGPPADAWPAGQAGQPTYSQPSAGQPAFGQPSFGQPASGEPVTGQYPVPGSGGQPPAGRPSFGQPSFGQPASGEPVTGQYPVPGADDKPVSGHGD